MQRLCLQPSFQGQFARQYLAEGAFLFIEKG
jgi:hypothetical protein